MLRVLAGAAAAAVWLLAPAAQASDDVFFRGVPAAQFRLDLEGREEAGVAFRTRVGPHFQFDRALVSFHVGFDHLGATRSGMRWLPSYRAGADAGLTYRLAADWWLDSRVELLQYDRVGDGSGPVRWARGSTTLWFAPSRRLSLALSPQVDFFGAGDAAVYSVMGNVDLSLTRHLDVLLFGGPQVSGDWMKPDAMVGVGIRITPGATPKATPASTEYIRF